MPIEFDGTGLRVQSLDEILVELQDAVRGPNGLGPEWFVGKEGVLGQFLGALSEREFLVQQAIQAVYDSHDKDTATGKALDSIACLLGLEREPATQASGTLTLTGDPATLVPSGSLARKSSTGEVFETAADATLTSEAAWVPSTAYSVGDRVTNSSNVYQCIAGGTSDTSGGPSTQDASIADGSVTWTFVGLGTASIDVSALSEDAGAVDALARTVDEIVTTVGGWDGVLNLADFDAGQDVETDTALRARILASDQGRGCSTDGAILADVLELEFVDQARVISNRTDAVVAGQPAHSVHTIVWPDTLTPAEEDEVAATIFGHLPAGIESHGVEEFDVTPIKGDPVRVRYSFASAVPIYFEVEIVTATDDLPLDFVDQVKAKLLAECEGQDIGQDVIAYRYLCAAGEVEGIEDLILRLGTAPAPTGTINIPISDLSIATCDSGDITVFLTP